MQDSFGNIKVINPSVETIPRGSTPPSGGGNTTVANHMAARVSPVLVKTGKSVTSSKGLVGLRNYNKSPDY
ncbi:hypothetical protein P70_0040 [Listeria phage P70]|uniref:Uncharacterized protein n=1 Tax=Listeria phage P70 TaxID=1225800 RepID=J9QSM0_9CAUD|nr:hypothetical protein P70_0040 [Listeria phage P70]AFQ96229.1 hypothetical protein P70_0040 [Listeria phage P70]